MLTWNDAPKDATHQHAQSKMFYKVEGNSVFVWSSKGGWNKSKVSADSASLLARPTEEKEMPEIKTLEFDNLEDLRTHLLADGVPEEVIEQIVASVEAAEAGSEEECTCEVCTKVAELQAELSAVVAEGLRIAHEGKRMANEGNFAGSLMNISKAAQLAARKAEIELELRSFTEEGKADQNRKEIEELVDKVVEKVATVAVPKEMEDFRMYAGVTIAALRDMGLLAHGEDQ
ncbi:hypothetical protein [Vibrio phage PhiImVa-1]|nr:hypothetical protein [Vibrio phage PhiImVa-1]